MTVNKSISDAKIHELYLDPKFGLSSAAKFYSKLKNKGYNVKLKQVEEAIKQTETSQVMSQKNKTNRKHFFPIYGRDSDRTYLQADLAFIPKYKKQNQGFAVLLTAININTKKAYAYPLTSKTVRDKEDKRKEEVTGILPKIRQLIKDANLKGGSLSTDSGSEFTNSLVANLLKENDIEHFVAEPEDHTRQGVIERFNRTLKQQFSKINTSTNKYNWYNLFRRRS